MIFKCLGCVLFLFLVLSISVFAQDGGVQSGVDYKINKMKIALKLTDSQIAAIRPVIKDYLIKRQAVLEEASGQGIVDHVAVKSTMQGLKESEYQKLGKILSQDQMQKWIDKDNLMAALNPDSAESADDDGVAITPNGADFKF